MSSMAEESARRALRELEFIKLLEKFLPVILQADIIKDPKIGVMRPDFLAVFPSGGEGIIEAMSTTPNTQSRLKRAVERLVAYSDGYEQEFPGKEPPELILAVPGTFSPKHFDFIHSHGIARVIDGRVLRAAGADSEDSGMLAEPEEAQPIVLRERARELLERLDGTAPGRPDWPTYQRLCGDILEFLLCPPLSSLISELPNSTKVNRRDFVLPNYASTGFWEYMRAYYDAHYVIVESKNYLGNVKKKEVLQLANYLSVHGAGLFGIIVCRNGGDRSAEITRREQWVMHRKMILILNDDDLRQMMSLLTSDGDPSELLRQKLEEFRLGF